MIYSIVAATVLIIVFLYLVIQYSFLIPSPKGLAVLMYHKVSDDIADNLTVTCEQLESHFRYIKHQGYSVISFQDLEHSFKSGSSLPDKPVIITFDDGYMNNFRYALPLLEKYGFKATIFIPSAFIGKTNTWDEGAESIMDAETLRGLTETGLIDIGLHSHHHKNYEHMDMNDIRSDLTQCIEALNKLNITHNNVIAYPYGKFPGRKKRADLPDFQKILEDNSIRFGLKIGSEINRLPLKSRYELTRINIKGSESFFIFKTKLKKGRAKLFK